ncbi:superinfection immunity protein [Streptomyces noursei]|uniref:superinfection immunity protein n=1 Tax=Streptomyces noursei TaxID=1971 RepID=UPI001677D6A1|nr:superinfection immunity protein [Streptomyces noursei]MCZ1017419.1 superinfection immunity protein [Streptomyces noursei]
MDLGPLEVVVLSVVGFLLYFLPAFVAFRRGSESRWLVLLVNVVFGATLVGWGVALFLATRRPGPRERTA